MTPILWRITAALALVCALIAAVLIYGQKQYRAGHVAATAYISAELAKAATEQAATVLQKEREAAAQFAAAQAEIEKEKANAKKSIDNLRTELGRVQKYAANHGGSGNLPKAAQTTGTPDNAATAKGWQLFGKCTAEYAGLAEVADGQLADLNEWRAYGRVVQGLQ